MTEDHPPAALSDTELENIDGVYHSIVEVGLTYMDISDRTHGEIWQLAENGEELPLYTASSLL